MKDQESYRSGLTGQIGQAKVDEVINHPAHYGGDSLYEPIKVIQAWGLNFALGNVLKYIYRDGKKDSDILEDLQKARKYIDFEIEHRERELQGGQK